MNNSIDIRKFKHFPLFKEKFLSYFPEKAFKNDYKDICWNWEGPIQSNKYGHITWSGKIYLAHRIAYIIFNGLISNNQVVRHTCNNRACVNPNHLIIGSQSDNCIDKVKNGSCPKTKLNEEAVKVIKWMLKYRNKRGLASKLALLYNISPTTVFNIKRNNIWHWINV